MADVKQVIVMRKDLKMRRGKEIAQGAHASMSFIVKKTIENKGFTLQEMEWMKGLFTKVCVRVDSVEELDKVVDAARAAGLQVEVITDSGKTEFAGVPTKTCIAIGPDMPEKIDPITGHLELY